MNLGIFATTATCGGLHMPGDQGFVKIQDLVASITERLRALEGGRMDLNALDRLSEEARELYERLVVLRHKARETKVTAERSGEPEGPSPLHVVHDPPPIRLDILGAEPPRQIDLIEAIEGQKKEKPSRKPKTPAAPGAGTIADKIQHAPIKDLAKSIALSQKFWFTAELFARDGGAYEQAIKRINASADLDEAKALVRTEVLAKLKKPPGEDVITAFLELVERRFK